MKEILPDLRISEAEIERISKRRANQINAEARMAGQPQRVTASQLEELYYKQLGRCAITGFPLEDHGAVHHPLAIRADHIENVRRQSTFTRRAQGENFVSAPFADIENIQWVCHMANMLKQSVVLYGMDYRKVIFGCYEQAAAGFPLRTNAGECGNRKIRTTKRIQFLQSEFDKKGHLLNSREMHKHFAGTELDACYQTVLREMKSIGWCGQRHASAIKKEMLKAMAAEVLAEAKPPKRMREWCNEFNAAVHDKHGWPGVSIVYFTMMCDELSVSFPVKNQRRVVRQASSSEKLSIRQFLKGKNGDGAIPEEVASAMASDTFIAQVFDKALSELLTAGQVEKHEGRLFYCMNRNEAAKEIGVSIHRLKKWAWAGIGPEFLKTPFNVKGECYYSVRTLGSFIESRQRTRFDLLAKTA